MGRTASRGISLLAWIEMNLGTRKSSMRVFNSNRDYNSVLRRDSVCFDICSSRRLTEKGFCAAEFCQDIDE